MSSKIKIIADSAIPFLRGRLEDRCNMAYMPGDEFSNELVKDADALIVRTRTRCDESLLKGSSVKLIVTATIGMDHIDIPWCESNGITVKSAPGCNAPGVAQYVISSLSHIDPELQGKTIGVIGYGNVGSIVAEWADYCGMNVLVCDPPRKKMGLKDRIYLPMEKILSESDIITLHVPLTSTGPYPTYHLIGGKELSTMKSGTVIVNTSRGGIVNESALKEYLRQKRVKAIIDVWENEPDIDMDLMHLASIATPHIAGYSYEGKQRATEMAVEAVNRYFGFSHDGILNTETGNEEIRKEDVMAIIRGSYNPLKDDENLRNNPVNFEFYRNNYQYRHEPDFNQNGTNILQ